MTFLFTLRCFLFERLELYLSPLRSRVWAACLDRLKSFCEVSRLPVRAADVFT